VTSKATHATERKEKKIPIFPFFEFNIAIIIIGAKFIKE